MQTVTIRHNCTKYRLKMHQRNLSRADHDNSSFFSVLGAEGPVEVQSMRMQSILLSK